MFLIRGILVLLPFAAWFAWSAWAKRTGRPMGSTPWPWLLAAGLVLAGASLLLSAAFRTDNRDERYVPGEVMADGRVSPGHFEPVK